MVIGRMGYTQGVKLVKTPSKRTVGMCHQPISVVFRVSKNIDSITPISLA
ncbi:hypothetical protein PLUTE_a4365 [Pseudoalteromonas luteoviolacea DSM 6061]|nr:hypothetical protein [Pseudoalteromonas luteoviolacea DSM 6061]